MIDESLSEVLPLYGRLMRDIPGFRPHRLEPYTRWLRDQGRTLSRRAFAKERERIQRRIDEWFSPVDIVISPTTA